MFFKMKMSNERWEEEKNGDGKLKFNFSDELTNTNPCPSLS